MDDQEKNTPRASIDAQENFPQPSEPEKSQWIGEFLARLSGDKTANRAWVKIEKACKAGLNLDQFVARTLFEVVTFSSYVSKHIKNGLAFQNATLKAACRADSVAAKHSGDARAEMFEQRRTEAVQNAAKTAWPFQNPSIKTLGEAALAYPEIGAKTLDQAVSSKEAESLRRWESSKIMLAVLRAGLRAHGVELSPRALSALAACADPDWQIDERTLRRFFREPTLKVAEQGHIELFDSRLDKSEAFLSQSLSNS